MATKPFRRKIKPEDPIVKNIEKIKHHARAKMVGFRCPIDKIDEMKEFIRCKLLEYSNSRK